MYAIRSYYALPSGNGGTDQERPIDAETGVVGRHGILAHGLDGEPQGYAAQQHPGADAGDSRQQDAQVQPRGAQSYNFV